ncbi:MAG: asparaginase [Flavobacteriaceae bacterium]|nr:asparaginase [Flavobacteriaceae bacterium]
MKRNVLIIYTGGTIGMEKDYATGSLKPFNFDLIFDKLPEIKLLECETDIHSFHPPLDSSDIGPQDWVSIAKVIEENYAHYDGFLILHGTDTMAYTSSALSFMLKGLRKPVILTGSQLPIGDLRTDAKENLLTSLYYASLYQNNEAVIQEVALYFEHQLLRGNRSLKFSSENFDAFHSPNYPILGKSGVSLNIKENFLFRPNADEVFSVDYHLNQSVLLCRIFPGMDLSYLLEISLVKVMIIQVFGSGTIFGGEKTLNILQELRKKGTEIIGVSQCISGGVSIGKYENSNIFGQINAISGKDISVESALTKTMHLLENPNYSEDFAMLFAKNLRGEISE